MSSLPSPIGVAVAGFAHGHVVAYSGVLQERDDVRLVAAWDSDAERGQKHAEQFGMEFCESLEQLLARDDVHAVMIANETNKHCEVAIAACEAGKAVLLQKPMAISVEECDRIIEAVRKSGVHFSMAFQMRCDPLNKQIKKWVDEGALGKVGAIRRRHCIHMLLHKGFFTGSHAWHIDPEQNVGMFFDDAVHAADFLYWVMGEPESVMAEIGNTLSDEAPDDCGMAIYRWPSGAMGTLYNSGVAMAGENTCEVYGDKGVIIQNYDDLVSTGHAPAGVVALKLYRKDTEQWENFDYPVPPHHGERIKAVAGDWIEKLKNNLPPTASAEDGKVSVAMCAAAYESSREGKRVAI